LLLLVALGKMGRVNRVVQVGQFDAEIDYAFGHLLELNGALVKSCNIEESRLRWLVALYFGSYWMFVIVEWKSF
jgi:hypothetical protein